MAPGACHGRTAILPPPPVLGRSMLGAVDMPIGCALTLSVPNPSQNPSQIAANTQQTSRRALSRAGGLTAHAAANDGKFG
jgi:hypothetical protein